MTAPAATIQRASRLFSSRHTFDQFTIECSDLTIIIIIIIIGSFALLCIKLSLVRDYSNTLITFVTCVIRTWTALIYHIRITYYIFMSLHHFYCHYLCMRFLNEFIYNL